MWGTKKERVYLDWAASAPVSARARRAFDATLPFFGNPSAPYAEGREAKTLLEDARTRIARIAEVKTDGVIFTSGATEANALALLGSVRAKGAQKAHVLHHPSQHASVQSAVQTLRVEGATVEEIQLDTLTRQLTPSTVLVTLDAVCGETGTLYDTLAVRRTLDAYRPGILLHVDASQAPLVRSFTLAHLGADLVTLDSQKVGGVRGIGVLLLRQGITLSPLYGGGGQEGGRRAGTENTALARAFTAALEEAEEKRKEFCERSERMRANLCIALSKIERMEINQGVANAPHILNISLLGRDTDYVVALLDVEGFAVSTKSACETDEHGSRAVFALTADTTRADSTLRISWGPTTKAQDLDALVPALLRTVRFLDEKAIY